MIISGQEALHKSDDALNHILPLADIPALAVSDLLDAAFGPDRHGRTAYRIRLGMDFLPALSFACCDDDGRLVGSIQCWPISLVEEDGAAQDMILVGPVAVSPDCQRQGIGRTLFQTMMDVVTSASTKAEQADGPYDALVLIGDPEYYGRFFGFTADETQDWEVPGPVERRRLLAFLQSPRLKGKKGLLGPRQANAVPDCLSSRTA